MWGSRALAERKASTSPVRVRRTTRASTSAPPVSLWTSRPTAFITSASTTGYERGDHVQSALLVQLALSRDRPVEHRHLDQLAAPRARPAGAVGDRRHASVAGRVGDRAVAFRRRAGAQGDARPVGQRQSLELLEPLRRHERRRRFAVAHLDAAGGVLEPRGDGDESDGEDDHRHEDLAQREAPLVADRPLHRTLTRPVAATTTVRIAWFTGFVTVYVPAGLAAPRLVNTTFDVVLMWSALGSEILITPAQSVPGPVQIVPAHPRVRSRMFVPVTSTHTVVFWEIAICLPRLITVASSRAAAWRADIRA